jgi:hypothetical protein
MSELSSPPITLAVLALSDPEVMAVTWFGRKLWRGAADTLG